MPAVRHTRSTAENVMARVVPVVPIVLVFDGWNSEMSLELSSRSLVSRDNGLV